jgi:hypothetical protein
MQLFDLPCARSSWGSWWLPYAYAWPSQQTLLPWQLLRAKAATMQQQRQEQQGPWLLLWVRQHLLPQRPAVGRPLPRGSAA